MMMMMIMEITMEHGEIDLLRDTMIPWNVVFRNIKVNLCFNFYLP